MKLTKQDREILSALDSPGSGGFLTRDVARRVGMPGGNRRMHSGAVRSWIVQLTRGGLVEPMDNEKPVCWRITPAGRAALQATVPTEAGQAVAGEDRDG